MDEFPICISPQLLTLARESAGRCVFGGYAPDAVAAVVLSWAALEAMLNEFLAWLEVHRRWCVVNSNSGDESPGGWEELHGDLLQANEAREQPLQRFDLVVRKLTGKEVSRGQGARQQLGFLARLRNALTHFDVPIAKFQTAWATPEEARREGFDDFGYTTQEFPQTPRWLRALESKALLLSVGDKPGDAEMDWSLRVCSREVADWALSTVVDAAKELSSCVPKTSELRRFLEEETLLASTAIRPESTLR